jgi:hypothetical protein
MFNKKAKRSPVQSIAGAREVVGSTKSKEKNWLGFFKRIPIIARRNVPEGYVVKPTGNSFVRRNEQVMEWRKELFQKEGIKGQKLEGILRLYRVRKAFSELSYATGYCTVAVAQEMIPFLQTRVLELQKGDEASKRIAEQYKKELDFIRSQTHTWGPKGVFDSWRLERKLLSSPMHASLPGIVQNAERALYPNREKTSRLIDLNMLITKIAYQWADEALRKEAGDLYKKIEDRVEILRTARSGKPGKN